MDSGKLNDWLQVVGMFGVIASLIFVGLQMQQTRDIAVSEAYQLRASAEADGIMAAAGIPHYVSGTAKLFAGRIEELTPEERVALSYGFGSQMTNWENDHFQYQSGYLSEEHWAKTLDNMKCDFALPFHQEHIEGWSYRKSFLDVVDQVILEAKTDPMNCWDL
jgi:hypothetical protein